MPYPDIPASKRLKVLVSAYACSPYRGSEPGMGWGWIKALSKYHNLWVITEKDEFQADIEAELNKKPQLRERIKFFYISRKHHWTLAKIWPPSYYWFYRKWQKKVYDLACSLHKEIGFDMVHQLNMTGYREPGYLWKLPLPFIWGPICGFVQTPWPFMRVLGWKGAAFYSARNIVNSLQMRLSIRVRAAMRRADALLAATEVGQQAIQRHFGRTSVLLSETGVSLLSQIPPRRRYDKARVLKLCWCGRLIGGKALPLALHALSRLPNELHVELAVIGDGPERDRWVALAEKLGLDSMVRWHGWVNHEEAISIISQSDAMLLTSLQDATSNVVMEALSFGVPVICHNLCGFGTVVDETCGIKIPAKGPLQSIEGFACAIRNLANSPTLLARLSDGAISRASELTWERKMDTMESIYHKILKR